MDVVDAVSGKDALEMNGDLDADVGSERVGQDSDPYNGRRTRFPNVPDANEIQTRPLHVLRAQVGNHFGAYGGRPNLPVQVLSFEGPELLGSRVRFVASLLNPGVDARARNETGSRG